MKQIRATIYIIFFGAILQLSLSSCHRKKQVQNVVGTDSVMRIPDTLGAYQAFLVKSKAELFSFKTFSAKINADYEGTENDVPLIISLRIINNEKIWMSISPGLGIEAARVLFTPDSVKVLNRLKKECTITDYSMLTGLTTAKINFRMLQNLLTGNPVLLDSTIKAENIRFNVEDKYTYVKKNDGGTLYEMYFNKNNVKIEKQEFTETLNMQNVKMTYSDFKLVEKVLFPYIADLVLQAGDKKITAKLSYNNIAKDGTFETPFNIPENYKIIYK